MTFKDQWKPWLEELAKSETASLKAVEYGETLTFNWMQICKVV